MQHHPDILIRRSCRACKGNLQEVLNLGSLKLNAFPQHLWDISQIASVPLILTVCAECGLAQLDRTVPPDWLYRQYWYKSGVNEIMRAELQDVVHEALMLTGGQASGPVLDIGANDGTLLRAYETHLQDDLPLRVAVEPALNLRETLRQSADVVTSDYFPTNDLDEFAGQFRIITAIACAYDVEVPVAFFQAIHALLAPGGVAIIQFQDLEQQLRATAVDNVCHEHLEYYTLWSLRHILLQCDLTVQRVQTRTINGGSLRVILRRVEDRIPAEQNVADQLLRESYLGLDTPRLREGKLAAFSLFRDRIRMIKQQVLSCLQIASDQGAVIDILGASTKGNILQQIVGVGPEIIRQAIDRSPDKWGYRTITGIPIVSEEQAALDPADVYLTLIWQFREGLLERYRWMLQGGRTLVFPLPQVEVVRESWVGQAERD